jgi:predicted ATPase
MHPKPTPPARASGHWRVRLLGGLEASSGDAVIRHWPSQPTALLLATLAMAPGRPRAREALIELLWPGAPPQAGRNRLRQALSALRRLLEDPARDLPVVLHADHRTVHIDAAAVGCDAAEFERALAEHRFADARAAWGGELMPGIYDDWVVEARERLNARYEALDSLAFSAGQSPPSLLARPRERAPGAPAAAQVLPSPGGPLLGRHEEQDALSHALAQGPLVTLTGPGGCGKTRLALAQAHQAAGFELVAFVPLAACQNAEQAASQLRSCLQLPPTPGEPLAQVVRLLATRRALVVLDNFEQVEHGASLVRALLEGHPAPTLLVTSRRPIGVAGERELALGPLPTPPPEASLASVAANPSVALFVHCARGVRPDFQVTARNYVALAALCRALEGLPLAIELAASRTRAFSVVELLHALAEPLALLARRGARERAGMRHDSMRATLAWSWRLLGPDAQSFLAALSVLRSGWTAADAAAVTQTADARAMLEALATDSLVRCEPAHPDAAEDEGELRFQILEVIRAFAAEQLDAQRAAALRVRHRAHFLALARSTPPGCAPAPAALPNLLQALRSALADGDPAMALELLMALGTHWAHSGMPSDLLAQLSTTALACPLPRCAAASSLLAQLHLDAGDAAAARALADHALLCAGGDALLRAAALCSHVRVVAEIERSTGKLPGLLEEALALSRGDLALQGEVTEQQAALAMRLDHDPIAAGALLQRAAQLYRQAGRPERALALRYERALCLRGMRRWQAALEQAELCELECARAADGVHRVRAIHLQGVLLAEQRRWADALDAYRRCVHEAWALHAHYWLVFALWNHGRNLARLRRPELAAQLMAFAEQYWCRHFSPLHETDLRFARLVRRLVRAQIGRARTQSAWVEGARWTLAQAVAAALGEAPYS